MSVCFHGLNRLGERYLELLPAAALQSTLVAAVVLVAVFFLRRRSAHLRYGLLMVVLAKFAIPGIVQAPWSPFPRVAATEESNDLDLNTSAPRADTMSSPGSAEQPDFIGTEPLLGVATDETEFASEHLAPELPGNLDQSDWRLLQASALPHDVEQELHGQASDSEPLPSWNQPAGERLTGAACLLLFQLAGTAILLFILVVDAVRLRRLVRAAEPAEERHRQVLDGLTQRLRMRRQPRLLVSDHCRIPFAAGWLRPLIMLPRRSLQRLDPAELEAVLGHELLHLRRGDLWVNLLQLWVRACWWWHPLVWYLNRQIKTVREDCCDDTLLAQGWVHAGRYCETLLAVARDAVAAGPSRLSVSMTAEHPLGHRIRRIMDSQVTRHGHLRVGSAMMIVIFAIVVLPTVPPSQPAVDSDVDTRQLSPQVVDEENRPLGGVHLAISYERAYAPFWMKPQQFWSTKTGDDGRPQDNLPSEIPVDQPAHQGRLWVYRPGIGLAAISLPLHQPLQTIPDQIRLAGTRSTVFTIENAEGSPASGTQVRISSFYADGSLSALPDDVADALTATADDQGIVRLPKVDGGWIDSIELTSPEGAKEMISIYSRKDTDRPPLWPQRVVLGAVGQVSGNVTGLAGESRQSARVFLISQSGEGLVKSDENQEVSHVRYVDLPVDADGGFRGNAVPVGAVGGRIYRDDQWLGAIAPTHNVRPGEEVVIKLQATPLASVSFPVIDSETELPVAGARVLVSGSNRVDSSAVGVDGNWPVMQLPRGAIHNYSFDLPDDFLPLPWRAFEVSVPDNVDVHTAGVIRARRSGRIEAKVLQSDGTAGDGYHAVVSWAADPQQEYSMPGNMTATVDADGRCELRVPKDEPFTVRIVSAGNVIAEQADITWQADRKEALKFSVPIAEKDSVSGRVVDDQGAPVSGVDVSIKKYVTDGINSFGLVDVASARTDESGVYRTIGEYTTDVTYSVILSPSNEEWESDESVKIQRRDGQQVVVKDLRVRPASRVPVDADSTDRRPAFNDAVELRVRVSDADGRPIQDARVVVWSAGQRSLRHTDMAGQAKVPVRSSAWVIAGGVDRSDHTGRFVEDPRESVEIVLPGQGKSEPSKFSDAPIPAPLRTAIRDSVDALLRRIVADGSENQRADAIKLLAELKPETAIQSAAALEDPAHRAAVQAKLALQVDAPLRQRLFDTAIESARSVASAEERGIALLDVAGQLHRSGDKAGAKELATEAVSQLPPRQAEGPARQLRMAAAVRLALFAPEQAMTLWSWDDEIEPGSQADRLAGSMAAYVAATDPGTSLRLLQLVGPYYRDQFAPQVAFKMAAVDLSRAEQVVTLIRDPARRVFGRVAIAVALSETAPQQAKERLLDALDRLEQLADRGYKTGGSGAPLFNVGMTLLPWIARVAPERMGDSFWRVLALRDSSIYTAGYYRLLGQWGTGERMTADPVAAALISHFDNGLARKLLMPPDDTLIGPLAYQPYVFLAALTVVDPGDALIELGKLHDVGLSANFDYVEACRHIIAMLDRDGWDRWNWIESSLHGLKFK